MTDAGREAPPAPRSRRPRRLRRPRRPRRLRRLRGAWRYVLATLLGLVFFGFAHAGLDGVQPSLWLLRADLVAGGLAIVSLRWRHRFPVLVMLFTNLTSVFGGLSAGAWMVATGSMATRRRHPEALLAMAGAGASAWLSEQLYRSPEQLPWWAMTTLVVSVTSAILGFGWYVGARRDLLASYRERAEAAERAQADREAQARSSERAAIAREMHDVLAHRISLLAMHAGALSYREDLSREQTREVAGLIRQTAHQALEELRGVLGALRDGDGETGGGEEGRAPAPPQPTLADLPALLAEADQAAVTGGRISLDDELPPGADAPDGVGRHVYRIVQEALTNARKHAPYAPVSVALRGAPGARLEVEVSNPMPSYVGLAAAADRVPGAGLGLIGLAERASLAGGGLRHGPTDDGRYLVRAWLPWPAGDGS